MDGSVLPTAETMHRGAKLFMDRGHAATYSEALGILSNLRIGIVVGDDVARSSAAQAALLTTVNVAARSLLGGVYVAGCPTSPVLTRLGSGATLDAAVVGVGGRLVDRIDPSAPMLLLGDVAAPAGCRTALRITWQGWSGGVVPACAGVRLAETGNMDVAAVLAASIAVGEMFQMLAGDCVYAGRREAGVSLWAPTLPWTDASARGPDLMWLPSRLWLIGLGNLGQAYLWCLGSLPYVVPAEVRLTLQDDDTLQPSNESTSVLTTGSLVGQMKTRSMARWAEGIGFSTRLEERRFGSWSRRSDLAEDPAVALCGVDNAEARAALEDAGFPLVVEAGLGAGPHAYRDWSLHSFPGARTARGVWSRVADLPATEEPSARPAYEAMKAAGADPCGVLRLASRTVGVPFVGLTAATMVLGEVLRRIHQGPAFDVIAATMSSLSDIECAPAASATPWLFGCTAAY